MPIEEGSTLPALQVLAARERLAASQLKSQLTSAIEKLAVFRSSLTAILQPDATRDTLNALSTAETELRAAVERAEELSVLFTHLEAVRKHIYAPLAERFAADLARLEESSSAATKKLTAISIAVSILIGFLSAFQAYRSDRQLTAQLGQIDVATRTAIQTTASEMAERAKLLMSPGKVALGIGGQRFEYDLSASDRSVATMVLETDAIPGHWTLKNLESTPILHPVIIVGLTDGIDGLNEIRTSFRSVSTQGGEADLSVTLGGNQLAFRGVAFSELALLPNSVNNYSVPSMRLLGNTGAIAVKINDRTLVLLVERKQ